MLDIHLTYPQGRGPKIGSPDSFPDGYIIMSGDPQEGVHVRLGIQPLPAPPLGVLDGRWPPSACDPPVRILVVLFLVFFAFCFFAFLFFWLCTLL